MDAKIKKNASGRQPVLGDLYAEILKSNFDDVTLRHINTEAQNILNGRSYYNRYDGKIRTGMREGGRHFAAASLICRADEAAGTKDPRRGSETEFDRGKRQIRLLEAWAKKADLWYDLSNLKDQIPLGVGGESEVYRLDSRNVVKLNTLRYTASPQILFDRIAIHNSLFRGTKMQLLGFGRNSFGEFCAIYKQPFIMGQRPTQKQIEDFLKEITEGDIKSYSMEGGWNYKNSSFLFDDFHEENVIVDKDGRLQVIDSDIRFNTVELGLGGKVKIKPVEEEIKRAAEAEISKQQSNSKAMKEKQSTTNNIHLEGPVRSCTIVKKAKDAVLANLEVYTAAVTIDSDGKMSFKNGMLHRVSTHATGENAKWLIELSLKKIDFTQDISKLDYVSVDGMITGNDINQQYVSVHDENFHVLDKFSIKNRSQIEGVVMETNYNAAYAGAVLQCKGEAGKPVTVSFIISAKDNPRKYNDLCSGKVKKGDTLSIKGPLMSSMYSNGEDSFYRCSVNVNNYETLAHKKTQKKKAETGMTL